MENSRFKFRAWVPAIKAMLPQISVNPDKTIGIDDDDFREALNGKFELWDDQVVTKLSEDGESGNEFVLSIMAGDSWLWLEEEDFSLMQCTGLKDKNGVAIYEGDIIKYMVPGFDAASNDEFTEIVEWQGAGFQVEVIPLYAAVDFGYSEVIGNIHQHSHLLS